MPYTLKLTEEGWKVVAVDETTDPLASKFNTIEEAQAWLS